MNTYKHARLIFARRIEMVRQMTEQGLSASQVAVAACLDRLVTSQLDRSAVAL